jgi:hypothetical protein
VSACKLRYLDFMAVKMPEDDFTIDYTGARGSNAGDEYHELWAVRQALRLLDDHAALSAMTVEGLTAQDGRESVWDGVDCALLFGGYAPADAARVELQQLKYSAGSPTSPWTVARLVAGRGGKAASSPIRRLADAYKGLAAARSRHSPDSLTVTFVTNQPIDEEVARLVQQARAAVPADYEELRREEPSLHRLVRASGLKPTAFQEFAQALDLQGQSGSRFSSEEAVLKAIAEWTDVEFRNHATRLREYVRERMLPESAGTIIDREKVLFQFGVSDERALFPCPPVLGRTDRAVPRRAARWVIQRLLAGQQRICLHGGGGVGKTTTLLEIAADLPAGSVPVIFDCYGGGSYQDASTTLSVSQLDVL